MALKDVLTLLLVVLIWAFNFIVIATGLHHFPPLLFSALRFLLASVPAAFIVGRGNVPIQAILGVGVTIGILQFSFLFVGMYMGAPPGLSSLVLQSQALFTTILATL